MEEWGRRGLVGALGLALALGSAVGPVAAGDAPVCLSPADLARLKAELAAEVRADVLRELRGSAASTTVTAHDPTPKADAPRGTAAAAAEAPAAGGTVAAAAPAAPAGKTPQRLFDYQPGAGLALGRLHIQGFADLTYRASSNRPSGDPSNEFVLGDFDLYTTARLTDRFSFLAETVFEAQPHESSVEVERLQATYVFSDAFRTTLGRVHTPLGWWNTAYHHGKWLQPTIDRPFAVAFEDDDGILPAHSVGLGVDGRFGWPRFDLSYDVGVANGRARRPDQVANFDDNSEKAFYGRWSVRPTDVPLTLGTSIYWDQIPRDPERDRPHEIGELVAGAHAVFDGAPWLVLAEYFHVHHAQPSHADAETDSWYVYAGRRFGRWTPYAMAEGETIDHADLYYETTGHRRRYTFGLKVDVLAMANVKVEYRRLDESGIPDTNQLAVQAAIAF